MDSTRGWRGQRQSYLHVPESFACSHRPKLLNKCGLHRRIERISLGLRWEDSKSPVPESGGHNQHERVDRAGNSDEATRCRNAWLFDSRISLCLIQATGLRGYGTIPYLNYAHSCDDCPTPSMYNTTLPAASAARMPRPPAYFRGRVRSRYLKKSESAFSINVVFGPMAW